MMFKRLIVWIIGVIAVFALAVSPAAAAPRLNGTVDRWVVLGDMTKGRGDPGVAVVNNRLHVNSGFLVSGIDQYVYTQEVYDPQAASWQIAQPIPNPRSDFVSVVVGDTIYAIGGWYTDPVTLVKAPVNHNEMYDPVLNVWTSSTSSSLAPLPVAVSGAGGVVLNDKIYVIGGFDNTQNTNAVQIYDPASNTWSSGTPMRLERSEMGAVVLDGLIYVIGGQSTGLAEDDVEIYDPVADSWSDGPAMPERRFFMAAVSRLGKIYVIGGFDHRLNGTARDTVYIFDPATGLWSSGPAMPTARGACRGAVIGDVIYVVAGVGAVGSGTANEALKAFETLYLPMVLK